MTGLLEYTGRPTARLSGKLHGAMIVPSQQEAHLLKGAASSLADRADARSEDLAYVSKLQMQIEVQLPAVTAESFSRFKSVGLA